MINRALVVLCAAVFALGLAACETEGPAEEAGSNIDESMEGTGDAMEETGDDIQDAAE